MRLGGISALNITVFCYAEVRIKPGLTGLPSSLCPFIVVVFILDYHSQRSGLFVPLYLFIIGAQNRQGSTAEFVKSRAL